jgi:hypothetical protein
MTPISDNSGIIDLYSLEQFITIDNLRQEALDVDWSSASTIPDDREEVISIFGKCWFAIIVASIQTVIKINTYEPIRFGYQPTASGSFSWSDEDIYDSCFCEKVLPLVLPRQFLRRLLVVSMNSCLE